MRYGAEVVPSLRAEDTGPSLTRQSRRLRVHGAANHHERQMRSPAE